MAAELTVAGNAMAIRRQDHIELPCRVDEIVEMRRIFLIPEDCGDAPRPAPGNQLGQLPAGGGGIASHPVLPGAVVAVPG